MARVRAGRTHVALNTHSAPGAGFVHDADWANPGAQCIDDIGSVVGADRLALLDAQALATQVLGDAMFTNPVLLGFAWQKGWIPLALASLTRAMELNGVAVERNLAAFALGRRAALNGPALQRQLAPAQVIAFTPRQRLTRAALEDVVQQRVAFLTGYQNAAYAQRYADCVARVQGGEMALVVLTSQDALPLSHAVARNLFKLMAYKDEYEVARLHADPQFGAKVAGLVTGDFRLFYHLAPPMLARKNARGELQKMRFGSWMRVVFRLLAAMRGVRGTVFDVFGHSAERREERALIDAYQQAIESSLPTLRASNSAFLAAFARVPEQIRGFGHVRARHLAAARTQWASLLAQYRSVD
jgi:indolepyruvate ferredoxin oxidoreductase